MNNENREVEKKFIIRGLLLDDINEILMNFIPKTTIERYINPCTTTDFYWKVPVNSELNTGGIQAQFVRLRDSWGVGSDGFSRQLKEITIKAKDKDTNVDRLELNIAIDDVAKAKMFLNLVLGPSKSIQKEECVIFIKEMGANGLVVISLAQIKGEQQVYLEIEGQSEEVINLYVTKLQKKLEFFQEEKSLYEIYIEKAF